MSDVTNILKRNFDEAFFYYFSFFNVFFVCLDETFLCFKPTEQANNFVAKKQTATIFRKPLFHGSFGMVQRAETRAPK